MLIDVTKVAPLLVHYLVKLSSLITNRKKFIIIFIQLVVKSTTNIPRIQDFLNIQYLPKSNINHQSRTILSHDKPLFKRNILLDSIEKIALVAIRFLQNKKTLVDRFFPFGLRMWQYLFNLLAKNVNLIMAVFIS